MVTKTAILGGFRRVGEIWVAAQEHFGSVKRSLRAGLAWKKRGNTGVASHIGRAQPPTNSLNGGLFHATAATKPDCAGAGSGERHDETEQTHF